MEEKNQEFYNVMFNVNNTYLVVYNHRIRQIKIGVQCTCIISPPDWYKSSATVDLKPMDSFGMWWKSNEIIFLHWIIILFVLCELLINALSIVCSEMLKLLRNNQKIKMLGVPPNTLSLVIYMYILT